MNHLLARHCSGIVLVFFLTGICMADGDSHRKAAERLLHTMNINQTIIDTVDLMVDLEIQKNQALLPYKNIMRAFFLKHMTGDVLLAFMSDLYMEAFNEQELSELSAFYSTPVGRKAIRKLPLLTQKGASWGQKQVNTHIEELKAMIADEAKRLEQNASQ